MSQDELNKINVPDPEVVPQAKRRRFSAEYKLRILEEAEACSERGQIGSLLRREGLYSSHLTTWRHQREQGQLEALSPKNRGRKPSVDEALAKELAELKRDNQRLENRLQQAETIIEVQKKLSGLLGLTLNENESDEAI
jgi:transposase